MSKRPEPKTIVAMWELLDAIEATISASDPAKREALAQTIDAYKDDFPDDFFWAVGAQAPMLLAQLVMVIDTACRPESTAKPRTVTRLIDREPEGAA